MNLNYKNVVITFCVGQETLLHEMIHAYLFVTKKIVGRDGHGVEFKRHMHRINNLTGGRK
jgi:predicted SprT family Zn-dependent metalloprotease